MWSHDLASIYLLRGPPYAMRRFSTLQSDAAQERRIAVLRLELSARRPAVIGSGAPKKFMRDRRLGFAARPKALYTAAPMASKKTSKSKSGTNKSAWIRSQPADKPAAEIVAMAKKAGIALSPGLVYAIRSADKNRKGKPSKAASVKVAGRTSGSASTSGLGGLEGAIRAIVREELRALLSRV